VPQAVGPHEPEVLVVLPPDHHIAPAHFAREQGHALVHRGPAGQSADVEPAEIVGESICARPVTPEGGERAAALGAIVLRELHQAQSSNPRAWAVRSWGKQHGFRHVLRGIDMQAQGIAIFILHVDPGRSGEPGRRPW
jgi:hypothetical protein